jgi:hypothetical protein
MTTSIGEPNVPYADVQIPELEDAADIRAALRIYHYGSNVSDPFETEDSTEKFANSIANELKKLQDTKRSISISSIPAGSNLNSYDSPGVFYASASAAGNANSQNFPLVDGVRRSGILFVEATSDNSAVVQKYVTIDSNNAINGIMFVRTKIVVGGQTTWSPSVWSRLSDSSHNHDDRYTQTILLTPELERRPTQINGKNASGTDLTGTRKIIVAAPIEVGGEQVPNITSAQQATLQPGDIWFW